MNQLSILKENKYYSLTELEEKLNVNGKEEIKNILLEISDLGFLKIFNNNIVSIGVERLFATVPLKDIMTTFKFAVRFVGIIKLTNDKLFLFYPKYLSDMSIQNDINNGFKKMIQIMHVIMKYKNRLEQKVFESHENLTFTKDTLGLKLQILKRYFESGLYVKVNNTSKLNGDGEVLWDETVNSNTAYIFDGRVPVYLDLIAQESNISKSNIIREVHKIIISEISRELESLLDIMKFKGEVISERKLEDLGGKYYLIKILQDELSSQFMDKNISILKELIKYLENDVFLSTDYIELYGTASFNLVWEDVCSVVYKNHLDFTFKSLGIINPRNEHLDTITMKEYIEKPQWLTPGHEYVEANSTLQLDVLNIHDGKLNIYDAKYYNIVFKSGKIQGQPGVSDITKQYLYQLLFKDVINLNNLSTTNSFIIPKDNLEEDNEVYTISKMQMFHELEENLSPITVIARDCENIFNEYLSYFN